MLFDRAFFKELTPLHATAVFPPEWALFTGHFPGEPLVPAYVLIGLVLVHAQHATSTPLDLIQVDRLKLGHALKPGDAVTSEIEAATRQGDVVKVRARLSAAGSEIGIIAISARVGA